jgi:hypothetical protein
MRLPLITRTNIITTAMTCRMWIMPHAVMPAKQAAV